MPFWREAGLNYVRYSAICAQVVRNVLKADFRAAAIKRDDAKVKSAAWEGGKQIKPDEK